MFFTYELAKQQLMPKRRRWSIWMLLLILVAVVYFAFRVF
ncbi:hypothetical protein SPACI_054310 [Sporomusa acidovorans DSM 3132]|uniref:Uncharacterized protein n=1 Tax=Sporomusa acidovorans (strain ATCC 49682 / DSM 3132 / Mol) TaxID=1123286 RepID=A0ABZ3JB87_SPOA4|nr:hypothetical protein SPACI_16840 [Sporomusa acidovorans DSM 3132]SDD62965.1 hypothetical protein SAMN04488499_1002258 [Sporomusa acidovorans]